MKVTKTSFKETTKLNNVWNKIVEWNDIKIGTVMWQSGKEWKIVKTLDFNLINDREDKSNIIAEFHTQEELWDYIKNKEV